MQIFQITVSTAFEEALGSACVTPAFVGFEDTSTGAPTVVVIFPQENKDRMDFADVKRALREDRIMLNFSTPDGSESFKFVLNKCLVASHSRPK